ncbi:secretion protein [Chryseobacterium artocarpi]|uniref:Secretion protein n=1 Tax=Chryseobacterium artocarpi TaxID=1414727 RepID=A0A1B8ZZS9_9FLAO|nr:T9SS type A sorting domain-containing protein [Chryseobacterium artocarpi]OCA77101.1 secretion protein [Chryseobacterium artocarpi]
MKKIYLAAFILTILTELSAQDVLWQRDIKSPTQDFLSQIVTTVDQQYLISGSAIKLNKENSPSLKQNRGYDFHCIKLNQHGEEVWDKYFGGRNHDYLSATVATQDGGFLLGGTSFSGKGFDKKDDSKGGSDIWLVRINENGDELWQKTLGGKSDEVAKAVIQSTDQGFFVAGNLQNSRDGDGKGNIIIIRLDQNGKEVSKLIFGGRGNDEVEKMLPTKDGGALLGVYSRSGRSNSKSGENYGEGDYWIVKLDKLGQIEWEKSYGGKGDDHLRTLTLTSTGYIIGGESRSDRSGNKTVGIEEGTDLWLISLDHQGNELWQKSYNFGNRDILKGMSILHSADDKDSKGILLGGFTQAEGRKESNDETFWILYLDIQGNEKWRKHVAGESKKKEERLADVRLNRDGSILLAGTSTDKIGKENWKIVKLGDKQINQLIEKQDIKVYPNPVTDYCYVEIGFDFKEADIIIYDMGGRVIQNLKTKNRVTKINTQSLIQGAYIVNIKTDTNKAASAKLIKHKQ